MNQASQFSTATVSFLLHPFQMRQLGKEALHDWAVGKEVEKVKEFVNDKDGIKQQGYGFNPALKGGLWVLEGKPHLEKTHTNSFSEKGGSSCQNQQES